VTAIRDRLARFLFDLQAFGRVSFPQNPPTAIAFLHVEPSFATVVDYPDGRLTIRYRGLDLPYTTFDKLRQVSQASIVSTGWHPQNVRQKCQRHFVAEASEFDQERTTAQESNY
jgi:hypothetical protein